MFIKISLLVALTMPKVWLMPTSDESELIDIMGDDETRSKRQAQLFNFIHQAIEKYEKCAQEHLAPLKLLVNYKPYYDSRTFLYPEGFQSKGCNQNLKYIQTNVCPQQQQQQQQQQQYNAKTTPFYFNNSQVNKTDQPANENYQNIFYKNNNNTKLNPTYNIDRLRVRPFIYNPRFFQQLLNAKNNFKSIVLNQILANTTSQNNKLVNNTRPSCMCSKRVITSKNNNKLDTAILKNIQSNKNAHIRILNRNYPKGSSATMEVEDLISTTELSNSFKTEFFLFKSDNMDLGNSKGDIKEIWPNIKYFKSGITTIDIETTTEIFINNEESTILLPVNTSQAKISISQKISEVQNTSSELNIKATPLRYQEILKKFSDMAAENQTLPDFNNKQIFNSTVAIHAANKEHLLSEITAILNESQEFSNETNSTTTSDVKDPHNSTTETEKTYIATTERQMSFHKGEPTKLSNTTKATDTAIKDMITSSNINQNKSPYKSSTTTTRSPVLQLNIKNFKDLERINNVMKSLVSRVTSKGIHHLTKSKDNNIMDILIIKKIISNTNSKSLNTTHPSIVSSSLQKPLSEDQLGTNGTKLEVKTNDSLENSTVNISLSRNGNFKSLKVENQSSKFFNKNIEIKENQDIRVDMADTDTKTRSHAELVGTNNIYINKNPYAEEMLSENYPGQYHKLKTSSPTIEEPKEVAKSDWKIIQSIDNNNSDVNENKANLSNPPKESNDYKNFFKSGGKTKDTPSSQNSTILRVI